MVHYIPLYPFFISSSSFTCPLQIFFFSFLFFFFYIYILFFCHTFTFWRSFLCSFYFCFWGKYQVFITTVYQYIQGVQGYHFLSSFSFSSFLQKLLPQKRLRYISV